MYIWPISTYIGQSGNQQLPPSEAAVRWRVYRSFFHMYVCICVCMDVCMYVWGSFGQDLTFGTSRQDTADRSTFVAVMPCGHRMLCEKCRVLLCRRRLETGEELKCPWCRFVLYLRRILRR
jgi:hypothetical protein